ncbi:MAG: LysR family transcriptional regulator [Clostridia bacterium]|nr:LysR family transcriptional regulator [Clostridia bacterium]
MDTRVLQYCVELSQHLNFTKVAESNFITQQALSQAIISLENQLGYKLFSRSNRSVKVTEAGKAFIEKAALGLDSISEAVDVGRLYAEGAQGRIALSFTGPSAAAVLQKHMQGFAMTHPNVAVELRSMTYKAAFGELDAGMMDLAFVPYLGQPIDENIYHIKTFPTGYLVVCVNKDHPLAQRPVIHPADLMNEVFITTSHNDRLDIRQLIDADIYSFLGGTPARRLLVHDSVSQQLMVSAGYGYALVMNGYRPPIMDENMVLREVKGSQHRHHVAQVWRRDNHNAALSLFAPDEKIEK